MMFLGITVLLLTMAVILIYKFNLEWIRVTMLFLLPSFVYALYGAVVEVRNFSHIFESFGSMFILSLLIMSPSLIVFATSTLLIEKKFKFNLLLLVLVSIVIGGLTASPYLLDSTSIGKAAFMTALSTAPIAVLIEGLFYRWRKNRRKI